MAIQLVARSSFAFVLTVPVVQAKAVQTDEGIVVLTGSEVSLQAYDSLMLGYRELRQSLIDKGILREDGQHFVFTFNYLSNSPSAAACVVVGYAINGREYWKDKEGRSIKQIEERIGE